MTPKDSAEEIPSTTKTSNMPDWWSDDPMGSDVASSSTTETSNLPDYWSWNSSNWSLVPTGATGRLCGLLAIISSLSNQTHFITFSNLEDLFFIALTDEAAQIIQELGEIATEEKWDRNFTEDHLDSILQEYGRSLGINLRLGIHQANDGWRMVYGRNALEENSN
ncbi:hypothetical protein N431DRAFT_456788 [Stipitochalara longipes BDJ]|nr:hypothetical protein N431DRAFT_456788 [Stipitochalara longipes BDJ]